VDAVIDLSGAPFFTKWRGDCYKREILGSRRAAIESLIEAMIPGRALHLMFGKAAITITHGQRVLPARALELGHDFRFPQLKDALADLVRRDGFVPMQRRPARDIRLAGI
jgi:NAD dependent epimerase/dehydratase family enzyme